MGDLLVGLAAVALAVVLWSRRVRSSTATGSSEREADLRSFGLKLLAVGLAGVGLIALVQFAFR